MQSELNVLSVENVPDDILLPRLIETYEMQRVGVVGQASFRNQNRPATLDGGADLEFMRQEMEAESARAVIEPQYGLLPVFPERGMSVGGLPTGVTPIGATRNFAAKPSMSSVKVKPAKIQNRSPGRSHLYRGGAGKSPTDMTPWGSVSEFMELSFDSSASAPAYRPSKVIRSVDNSMSKSSGNRDKPRAHTINPRLNSMELMVKIDQRSDYELEGQGIDIIPLHGGFGEKEFDSLLHFEEPATELVNQA